MAAQILRRTMSAALGQNPRMRAGYYGGFIRKKRCQVYPGGSSKPALHRFRGLYKLSRTARALFALGVNGDERQRPGTFRLAIALANGRLVRPGNAASLQSHRRSTQRYVQ